MKKILNSVFAIAIAALAFTSCDDVPMPYDTPIANSEGKKYEGASGKGTLEEPYNVAGVLNFINELGGAESEEAVYVKGKVASISQAFGSSSYGTGTFTITDEGTDLVFTVWRAYYLDNKKFAPGDKEIEQGDEVIICGKVINYQGKTPETVQNKAYVYSINGVGGGGETPSGEPSGDGTEASPFNVAAAIAKCKEIGSTESTDSYYIKGIVDADATANTQYNNITFDMVDAEGGEKFKAFQVKVLDGMTGVKKGDEVVVYGPIYNYSGNTPETAGKSAAKIVSYNNNGGNTPTPQPTGSNLLANGNFESWTNGLPDNWKTTSTAGNATLSQSTNAHGGSYAVLVSKATQNKRMAYKEITLKAGTYVESFYVRAADASAKASVRPGYVPVTDKVGSYAYGDYVNDITGEWQQVSHEFTLSNETKVCVLVMLPSNSGSDVIIDDFTLTTANGGLADGSGNTPDPTPAGGLSYDFKANGQSGWNIVDTNLPSGLTYIWSYDDRYGMKASAYANNTNYASESWLISPALDLSNLSTATLKISHAGNYFGGAVSDDCSVMVSTNYSSGNPSSATWTKLNVSAWPTSWTFVDATASLASVAGKSNVRIAFKYTSPASKAGTWEISTASIQ